MENIAKDVARHNLHPDAIPLHVSMAASTASCMDTTLLDTIVDADKEMLRYKHLRRKTTLKSIKDYIERYTCQLVTLTSNAIRATWLTNSPSQSFKDK